MFDYTCATMIYEMCVQESTATVSLFGDTCCILKINLLMLICSLAHDFYLQVTNVRHQEKPKYPPYPLSTIELEKRASRYFRMSSEQTMKVSSCFPRMCCIILIQTLLLISLSCPPEARISSSKDFIHHPYI